MIVLCPKAFSSADGLSHEREFLKYFLSRAGKKAFVANEVWETFRFKLINNNHDRDKVNKAIAEFRGVFQPEETILTEEHQEEEPKAEHTLDVMVEKTKDLIKRRWADIEMFITTEPDKFSGIANIEIITLQEFFFSFMSKDSDRRLLEEYWGKCLIDKWE
jgi:hypothetical protein